MSAQWKVMYRGWKAKNPTVPVEARRRLVRGCRGKKAFPNFLQALLAARKQTVLRHVQIYQCGLCGRAHLANRNGPSKYFKRAGAEQV